MHRSTVFLIVCIGVLAGIALASFVHIGLVVLWAGVFLAGSLFLVRRPRTLLAGFLLMGVLGGAWRAEQAFSRPAPLWDLAGAKAIVRVTGYVDGDFERTATGGRFTFQAVGVSTSDGDFHTSERVLINGLDWIRPRQGQWLVAIGKLQQPKSFPDFDYTSYLAKDDIHALMYAPQYEVPMSLGVPWWQRVFVWCSGRLAVVRSGIGTAISQSVPQPEAGYLAGILVGAKGNVDAQLKDDFAKTGTSHILAISGYNITIVATVLMMLLAPLGRRRSYWLAVAGIILFTLMVGAGASVVRAAIMGVMALTAQRLGRINDAGTTLAATAAVMCWCNPFLLRWDVGFQLSFLAFAGIVYVEPLLSPALQRMVRIKLLASTLATTISAQVLVLPLLLFDFGQLAVYTLPVNALVLPLVPAAMALGFATAVAGSVWSFAGLFIGQSAWLIAAFQLGIIRFAAALPYAAVQVHISPVLLFSVYAALVAWLLSGGVSLRSRPPSLTRNGRLTK